MWIFNRPLKYFIRYLHNETESSPGKLFVSAKAVTEFSMKFPVYIYKIYGLCVGMKKSRVAEAGRYHILTGSRAFQPKPAFRVKYKLVIGRC